MTAWQRLRLIEVEPETDTDKARRLADAIGEGRVLSEDDRRDAARLLRAWTAPKRKPGRPRDSRAPHIALDYLVQRELLGKAAAALRDVADAWSPGKESSVKDAWTDWQAYAKWRLSELTAGRVGRSRDRLLRDISADLRESHAAQGREK